MVRFFGRVRRMDDSRLTKIVFKWDKALNESGEVSTWGTELSSVLTECNMEHTLDQCQSLPTKSLIKNIENTMYIQQTEQLRSNCMEKPKLRTFIQIKEFGTLPSFIVKPLSFMQRKLTAKLRVGSLPLRIETGRYCKPYLAEDRRTCQVCESEDIENEYHFLFKCKAYQKTRTEWLAKLNIPEDFMNLSAFEKMGLVLNNPDNTKPTSSFISDIFNLRNLILSNTRPSL